MNPNCSSGVPKSTYNFLCSNKRHNSGSTFGNKDAYIQAERPVCIQAVLPLPIDTVRVRWFKFTLPPTMVAVLKLVKIRF